MSIVYTQRGVCRQFRDAIDSNLFLWQHVLGLTRRGSMQPVSLRMPKSLSDIKAFIPLDMKEYSMRSTLSLFMGDRHGDYTSNPPSSAFWRRYGNVMDYTDVVTCSFNERLDLSFTQSFYENIMK